VSVHHSVILYQFFPDNNNFEISALEILSVFVTIEVTGRKQQTLFASSKSSRKEVIQGRKLSSSFKVNPLM
jgi:hypothetical protein